MFYIIVGILLIPFVLYYLNINILPDITSFTFNKTVSNENNNESSTSILESSINELKNLNYYIDNGTSTSSPL